MTPEDFDRLQNLMAGRAGFALSHDRMQLAEHRLGPIARKEGFHNVEALLHSLWPKPVGSLGWSVIETLLNTETWFRRDRQVFDLYANELLPALSQARKGRPVRIWVAGGASGQEAFSLAMAALDKNIEVEIVSTDLSRRAIEKGMRAIYTSFDIQRGLQARTMLRYFDAVEDQWQAKSELRDRVQFERLNLLDPLPHDLTAKGQFDLVFCRYVLGDMISTVQDKVLDNLCQSLSDDGCLFLGLTEMVSSKSIRQVAGRSGLFVKGSGHSQRAA